MPHLIDKDALVAWIKNRFLPTVNPNADMWEMGADAERVNILNFINSLEVKEVDLEKEYKDFVEKDPVYNELVNGIVGKIIAKHFFELGLKAKGE